MSLLTWPFKRKTYPGLSNPRFVDDVKASNEAVIDAIIALMGVSGTDFFILSGLDYTAGAPGTYQPGIFFVNGAFYYISTVTQEGLYLTGTTQDTILEPFPDDGVARLIYTLFQGVSANAPAPPNTSPVLAGNMNQYRLGLKFLQALVNSFATTINLLRAAAFLNVGTTSGTVAAGDDARFGYTVAQINALFALQSEVLLFGQPNNGFVPTQPFDPATKGYVDNFSAAKCILIGKYTLPAVVTVIKQNQVPALVVTGVRVALGNYVVTHNLGTTNYFVTAIAASGNAPVRVWHVNSIIISADSFELLTSDDASAPEGGFFFQMWSY